VYTTPAGFPSRHPQPHYVIRARWFPYEVFARGGGNPAGRGRTKLYLYSPLLPPKTQAAAARGVLSVGGATAQ